MSRWLPALALALALVGLASAPPRASSQPACIASIAGTYSCSTRVSPRAGGACLLIATVFDGGTCEPARLSWSVELGCSEARRLRVTDRGRLVSILAPRASNPLWPIVRVFIADGPHVGRTSLRLRDLPGTEGLSGTVRMSFDATSLVMASRNVTVTLAIDELEQISPP